MPRTEMPLKEAMFVPADPRDPKAAKFPRLIMAYRWVQFWTDHFSDVDTAPRRIGAITLVDQNAAIGTSPIPIGDVAPGIYQISYYQAVRAAAGVTSSLTLTFRWTDNGVAKNFTATAMAGNTTTTYQQDTVTIRVDGNTAISYETAYASNPGGAMRYALDVQVETKKLDAAA